MHDRNDLRQKIYQRQLQVAESRVHILVVDTPNFGFLDLPIMRKMN